MSVIKSHLLSLSTCDYVWLCVRVCVCVRLLPIQTAPNSDSRLSSRMTSTSQSLYSSPNFFGPLWTSIKNPPHLKATANAVEQKGSLILLIFGIFHHAGQQTAQASFTIQIITNQMYTRNLVQCPNDRSQPWTLVVSSLVMLENYRTTEKS